MDRVFVDIILVLLANDDDSNSNYIQFKNKFRN